MTQATYWGLLLFAGLINSLGSLFLKQANNSTREGLVFLNPWFIVGLGCYGATFLIFSFSLSKLNLSVAYPILVGASFFLVTLGSIFWFQEVRSLRQYFGIGLILAGILATSL